LNIVIMCTQKCALNIYSVCTVCAVHLVSVGLLWHQTHMQTYLTKWCLPHLTLWSNKFRKHIKIVVIDTIDSNLWSELVTQWLGLMNPNGSFTKD